MTRKPSYLNFDQASYAWKPDIDYRAHPEKYRIGRGEQGVLICQPYKGELVGLWRFKTPDEAEHSSEAIWRKFLEYLNEDDFVGADLARKFLQMGFTRARRFANYKGGRKYAGADHHQLDRGTGDPEKAASAAIFYERWKAAEARPMHLPRLHGKASMVDGMRRSATRLLKQVGKGLSEADAQAPKTRSSSEVRPRMAAISCRYVWLIGPRQGNSSRSARPIIIDDQEDAWH